MPRTSDRDLVDALLRGSPGADSVYAETYGNRLFRFIVARTKNPADAEEIHNDTLARALMTWRPESGPLKAWLYLLASHAITAWARKTVHIRSEVSLDQLVEEGREPTSEEGEPPTQDRLAIHRARLREFVKTLPPREQQLFQLCIVQDLTDEQVATITGARPASVKTMRLRMVRKIKDALCPLQRPNS